MNGLMMDFQLTLPTILKRAETYFPHQEIVTRMPDRSFHTYSFADFGKRARQLAVALQGLGLQPGDRVATLCWNHYQHLEAYLGIPCAGFVLHTLNLRLHPNDLGYIATHAGDKARDRRPQRCSRSGSSSPTRRQDRARLRGRGPRLRGAPRRRECRRLRGTRGSTRTRPRRCATRSAPPGSPKGVLYSHRSTVAAHARRGAAAPLGLRVTETDTFLPVVPMFHANAWGLPVHLR